jgi:hypothetical protein
VAISFETIGGILSGRSIFNQARQSQICRFNFSNLGAGVFIFSSSFEAEKMDKGL